MIICTLIGAVASLPLDVLRNTCYDFRMIDSFNCKDTSDLFAQRRTARFAAFERVARRKLNMLHSAISLTDLKVPPGNKLEALTGKRKGQHSIRINDQWRICFVWSGKDAKNVEIVDYH
jgi:proteic killer suppression protein